MKFATSTTLAAAALAGFALAPAAAHADHHKGVEISLKPVYENLSFKRPVLIAHPGNGDNRRFLVLQEGKIVILPTDKSSDKAEVFLDLTDRNLIEKDFEEGLLGLAFHPKFKENGKFYIYHSKQDPKRSIISEWQVSSDNPNQPDPKSERVLMEIPQPFWNHNSGNMVFGADGMLYIGVGDGGKANDVRELAQNLFALNGKILRIDVDRRSGDRQYGIPKDNPFVKEEGVRPEIWSYGMRNPWGLAFDKKTGLLWCADVGQNKWEEIDIIVKGGNYGWSYREGKEEFNIIKRPVPKGAKFVEPVHQYPRTDGISITGGFVYYGKKIPALAGHYIYGDWGSGNLWALHYKDEKDVSNKAIFKRSGENANVKFQPTAFYETPEGEILALSWSTNLPGRQRGGIYAVEPGK